jgi:hypothetical protein
MRAFTWHKKFVDRNKNNTSGNTTTLLSSCFIIAIDNNMSTRSGKVRLEWKADHYGRAAKEGSTLPGQTRYCPKRLGTETRRQRSRRLEKKYSKTARLPQPEEVNESAITTGGTVRKTRRIMRSEPPTCLVFGYFRKEQFPDHLFCSGCDAWETAMVHSRKSIQRTSTHFRCTAGHTSSAFPTTLRKVYRPSHRLYKRRVNTKGIIVLEDDDDSSPDESSDEDSDIFPSDFELCDSSSSDVESSVTGTTADTDGLWKASWDVTARMFDETTGITYNSNDPNSKNNDSSSYITSPSELYCKSLVANNKRLTEKLSRLQAKQKAFSNNSLQSNIDNVLFTMKEGRMAKKKAALVNCLFDDKQFRSIMIQKIQTTAGLTIRYKEAPTAPNIGDEATNENDWDLEMNLLELLSNIPMLNNNLSTARDILVQHMWNKPEFHCLFLKHSREYFRTVVFPPWKILRALDLSSSQVALSSIEVLRTCETQGVKYYRGSILPCKAELQRCMLRVEEIANVRCPIQHGHTQNNEEFIALDKPSVLKLSLEAFQLDDVAKARNLRIAQAIDGAAISKGISHIMYGYKIQDPAAVCPITKKILFGAGLQSWTTQIPVKMIMAKETASIYDEFVDEFAFFNSLGNEATATSLGYKPFSVSVNSDMSATWKGLKTGGAAKVAKHPCHCCAVDSAVLEHPNNIPCKRWCDELHSDDPNFQCYHHEMLTESRMNDLKDDLAELAQMVPDESEQLIKEKSRMAVEDPRVSLMSTSIHITGNPTSIHFKAANKLQKAAFSSLLTEELLLRKMDATGNLSTKRENLREALLDEYKIHAIRRDVTHGSPKEGALFVVMANPPCILHAENRVGLKLLTMLLLEGIANVVEGLVYTDVLSEKKRWDTLFFDVQEFVNRRVLGDDLNQTQWQCPRDDAERQLGVICMDNTKIRKMMNKLDGLIDLCVVDAVRYDVWKTSMVSYRSMFVQMRKKEDLSTEEIVEFQSTTDIWFQQWIRLHGRDGITNYIHMLAAGHFSDYLAHYKNLFIHSQQGWEKFNHQVKTYYFR